MIDWHYPRTELAERYMNAFATGITGAISIFAPRRMGKTQFVVRDLGNVASARGYRVAYCSFWNLQDNPAKALRMALEETEQQGWQSKWRRYLDHSSSEVSASLGVAGYKLKNDLPRIEEDDLVAIIQLLGKLARGKTPLLLILDEIQHLADEKWSALVATLRTQFDQHRDHIHVVFTGSSRDGLQRLFRDRRTPMFHAAQQVEFPNFDAGFVAFMINAFHTATTRKLDLPEALRVFKKLDHNPSLFHHLLRHMVIGGIWDISEGFNRFYALVDTAADYSATWSQCKAIDQAVLGVIASGKASALYTEENRAQIAQQLGVDDVTTRAVQHALERLRNAQLVFNIERGKWVLEDPAFGEWICRQAPDLP